MDFGRVLIDGDQMVYAIGFASEKEPVSHALSTTKRALDKIQRSCSAYEREVWVRGTLNFRDEVAVTTGYKATRSTRKPAHFNDILRYLIEYQGAQEAHGMEADDMVSIRLMDDPEVHIVSSQDKDLMNTPGWHFNPKTEELFDITPEEALRHFWYQMVAGDRVDNIPGIPELPASFFEENGLRYTRGGKVGEKTAWNFINEFDVNDLPNVVPDLYKLYHEHRELYGRYEVFFREQGDLLWMARRLNADGTPARFTEEWELNPEVFTV